MSAVAAAAEDLVMSDRYERVPIDAIEASKTNPRTHFDESYIAQLADSIREKGLIQPIILRPHPGAIGRSPSRYEVVAGECRYRASKLAGISVVPAMVRDYTNEQVLELQLVENIHRTDLTPLEQAVGYRRLIDTNPTKHSAASIASRVGMSPAWVWDRLKLNDLVPEAAALLEQEKISESHAIVIARLTPKQQERVINPKNGGLWEVEGARLHFMRQEERGKFDGYKPVSLGELRAWITHHIRFDVQHAAKAAPLEFEAVAERVEQAAAKPGRGKKVVPITHDFNSQSEAAKTDTERTYGATAWRRADGQEKSKTCEYAVLGVVVAGGRDYGQAFDVCIARDRCEVHWGKEIREKQKNQKLRESGQTKKAEKNEKRQEDTWQEQHRRREEERKAWDGVLERALPALAEHLKGQKLTTDLVVGILDDYDLKRIQKLTGPITDKNIGQAVALSTVFSDGLYNRPSFLKSVKPFGFDLAAIEKLAAPKAAPAKPVKASKPAAAKKSGKKR